MSFSLVKLPGLDEARIVALVAPVLEQHRVEGVELLWHTDGHGWVLEVTVEVPGARITGQGVTVELCGKISRGISQALDALAEDGMELVEPAFNLLVGSPGVERALYTVADYERFATQRAQVKVTATTVTSDGVPLSAPRTFEGTLCGASGAGVASAEEGAGEVRIDDDHHGVVAIPFQAIQSGRLLFSWGPKEKPGGKKKPGKGKKSARGASSGRKASQTEPRSSFSGPGAPESARSAGPINGSGRSAVGSEDR